MSPRLLACIAVLGLLYMSVTSEAAFFRPVTRVVHYHSLPRYAYSRHVHVHEPLVRYYSASSPAHVHHVDIHPHHHHDYHHHDVEEVVEAPHTHAHAHPYYLWRRR